MKNFEIDPTEPVGDQIQDFLRNVITTVFLDEVVEVTDEEGDWPNEFNNYLLSDDGSNFSGLFLDADDETYSFTLFEQANGSWAMEYAPYAVA